MDFQSNRQDKYNKLHGSTLDTVPYHHKSQGMDLYTFDLCKLMRKRIQNLKRILVGIVVDFQSLGVSMCMKPVHLSQYTVNLIHTVRVNKDLVLVQDLELQDYTEDNNNGLNNSSSLSLPILTHPVNASPVYPGRQLQ